MLDKVREFHEKFGVPISSTPTQLDAEMSAFRLKFLKEELDEYENAINSSDIVKQFDSLLDLIYVALGTLLIHGFPTEEGFDLVHEANMCKVRVDRPENSPRGSSFDVVKPVGWFPPDAALERLVMHAMFNSGPTIPRDPNTQVD